MYAVAYKLAADRFKCATAYISAYNSYQPSVFCCFVTVSYTTLDRLRAVFFTEKS